MEPTGTPILHILANLYLEQISLIDRIFLCLVSINHKCILQCLSVPVMKMTFIRLLHDYRKYFYQHQNTSISESKFL